MGTDTHGLLVAVSWGSGSFVINAAVIVFIYIHSYFQKQKAEIRVILFEIQEHLVAWSIERPHFHSQSQARFPMARDANRICRLAVQLLPKLGKLDEIPVPFTPILRDHERTQGPTSQAYKPFPFFSAVKK